MTSRRPLYFLGGELLCSGGSGLQQAAAACLESRSGAQALRLTDIDGQPTLPYCGMAGSHALLACLDQVVGGVISQTGLSSADLRRTALFIGTSSGDIALHEQRYREELRSGGAAVAIRVADYGTFADRLARSFGIGGPRFTVSTACSASANALLYAAWMIGEGRVDHAIVVGIEFRNEVSLLGFRSLLLLARDGCRPFDRSRDGIVLGEAVAATALSANRTMRVDARWRLCGGASLCDATHPTGSSAAKIGETIRLALDDAGVEAGQITAIKAHGTGTPSNDHNEALGLRSVFGSQPPAFTSIKPVLGHTLGACGVAETLAIQACLEQGLLPATAGFREIDPDLGIAPIVANHAVRSGPVLLNTFGFGGNNCSLVMAPC